MQNSLKIKTPNVISVQFVLLNYMAVLISQKNIENSPALKRLDIRNMPRLLKEKSGGREMGGTGREGRDGASEMSGRRGRCGIGGQGNRAGTGRCR